MLSQKIIPNQIDRALVHDVIYKELCQGRISSASKRAYLEVIEKLDKRGANAIILACTEIGLLVQQSDTEVTLYDTTKVHASAAVEFMLS